jgi:hypothetical protein
MQQRSKQRAARISWQEQPSSNAGASGGDGCGSGSSDTAQPLSPSAAAAAARSRGSLLARLVARLNVGMLGRSKASPRVLAAAHGGSSSNPLLQQTPSVPRFPSTASLPSFSSSGSLQELAAGTQHLQAPAGHSQALQESAGCSHAMHQQNMQGLSQPAWHAAAHLPQQQQQQQHNRQPGAVQWMLSLLWYAFFAPLLPFAWVWRAAVKLLTSRGTHKQQNHQQQGLQHAYAQAYQPQAAAVAAAAAGPAAAVPAAARGPRRSIVFEQPSGFGVHERSKRRGLLEVNYTLSAVSGSVCPGFS